VIDTHVHLQLRHYDGDVADVLARAAAANVRSVIVPATKPADCRQVVSLAFGQAEGPCPVYAAVGVHPTSAHTLTDPDLKTLEELARNPHVVAIGEIGLDYYWTARQDRDWQCAEPEAQRHALRRQLDLATELDLPVIIHDRDAHTDTLAMLREWRAGDPRARGTLHSYAGGPELLQQVLDLGLYIGMDGPVTYRKARDLHEVARIVPLDRLLLETDGPFLTPQPHRGRRNEPAYLPLIAMRIAELRGVSPAAVIEATTANAMALFDLPVV